MPDPESDIQPAVVLIVEDEMLLRMSAADLLQEAGFHVVEAHDGVEALAVLEVRRDVGVLFSDATMPNMNGIALAKIVHERWPHIGIVITSGAMPPEVRLELPPGARFVRKPYRRETLISELRAVLPLKESGTNPALHSFATARPGMHGAGGLAQPLPEPEE